LNDARKPTLPVIAVQEAVGWLQNRETEWGHTRRPSESRGH
jgi:hypothetical protein